MSTIVPLHRPARQREPWPPTITIIAWRDPMIERAPGAMPTISDEFLVTGRVRVFGSGECCRTGRCGR